MTTQRTKEIETLRNRLADLEAEQAREERERETLQNLQAELLASLEGAGVSFESFVRFLHKELRRIIARMDREQHPKKTPRSKTVGRKRVVKKRKRRAKPVLRLKIPAGSYANLPGDPDRVYQVREKGARPKALKAYAEEIGLESFLAQCRLPDE